MENQFKIGDKVRLSSGESPMMTINEILYDGGIVFLDIDVPRKNFRAKCVWFDEDNKLKSAELSFSIIELWKDED